MNSRTVSNKKKTFPIHKVNAKIDSKVSTMRAVNMIWLAIYSTGGIMRPNFTFCNELDV